MHRLKMVVLVLVLIVFTVFTGYILSSGGITGGVVFEANNIACSSDADCDDHIAETVDSCRNPGTEFALCVSKPIK